MFLRLLVGIAAPLSLLTQQPRTGEVEPVRYTWCEALSGPPLTRYVSRVFVAPDTTTVDVPALFAAAVKANHHPRPQELSCDRVFTTRDEADVARATRLTGRGAVLKMPVVAVDWAYEASAR